MTILDHIGHTGLLLYGVGSHCLQTNLIENVASVDCDRGVWSRGYITFLAQLSS